MPKKKQARQPATLDEIRGLMDEVERRTKLNWYFSIGFGFMSMGSGLFSSGISMHTEHPQLGQGLKCGGIAALGVGFMMMSTMVLLEKYGNKSK